MAHFVQINLVYMGVSKSHLVKDVDGEGPVRVSASVCQSCTCLLLAMFTHNMSQT